MTCGDVEYVTVEQMMQQINFAKESERERCAKVADRWGKSQTCTPGVACDHIRTGAAIAEKIRSGE